MRILGIVVEYNPFHKGHIYHINKAKELVNPDLTIAVMSGNIVQRGQWAIVDKVTRASIALEYGVDLVLELPAIYTMQQADVFAAKAIEILARVHVTDVVFGSECNNLELLKEVVSLPINVNHLKEIMKTGKSYAQSLSAFSSSFASNDLLAIAYLKALQNYPKITPHTILRTNDYNDESLQEISSASAIRNAYYTNIDISEHTPLASIINEFKPNSMEDYYPILKHLLISLPKKTLQNIFLVSEGIENHLVKCALNSKTFNEFIDTAATRRYSKARIMRTCMMIINLISKEEVASLEPVTLIHPLSFNEIGKNYLKTIELTNDALMINRIEDYPSNHKELLLKLERNFYLFHPEINPLKKQGPYYRKG